MTHTLDAYVKKGKKAHETCDEWRMVRFLLDYCFNFLPREGLLSDAIQTIENLRNFSESKSIEIKEQKDLVREKTNQIEGVNEMFRSNMREMTDCVFAKSREIEELKATIENLKKGKEELHKELNAQRIKNAQNSKNCNPAPKEENNVADPIIRRGPKINESYETVRNIKELIDIFIAHGPNHLGVHKFLKVLEGIRAELEDNHRGWEHERGKQVSELKQEIHKLREANSELLHRTHTEFHPVGELISLGELKDKHKKLEDNVKQSFDNCKSDVNDLKQRVSVLEAFKDEVTENCSQDADNQKKRLAARRISKLVYQAIRLLEQCQSFPDILHVKLKQSAYIKVMSDLNDALEDAETLAQSFENGNDD